MLLNILELLLIVAYFYFSFLDARKRFIYKNDERYQAILAKRNWILLYCYDGLIIIPCGIYIFIHLWFSISFTITIHSDNLLSIAIPYLAIRTVLGYLIMRYYDKRL